MDPLLTFYHFHHVCVSNMKFEFYVEIKLQAPTVFAIYYYMNYVIRVKEKEQKVIKNKKVI